MRIRGVGPRELVLMAGLFAVSLVLTIMLDGRGRLGTGLAFGGLVVFLICSTFLRIWVRVVGVCIALGVYAAYIAILVRR